MTVRKTKSEAAAEVEGQTALLARATAAYIARLKTIADISTLTTGSHDFTYAVTVPQNEKLALLPRLADLTMDIEDEFGVKITTLAVAGPTRAR
ncbi:MAG: hypothetical protein JWM87_1739 [Candidatus Eremiobacteraeota bacterium]|nr:hypothetical protein [Candidatus Eremiobacteraeota bacterium]